MKKFELSIILGIASLAMIGCEDNTTSIDSNNTTIIESETQTSETQTSENVSAEETTTEIETTTGEQNILVDSPENFDIEAKRVELPGDRFVMDYDFSDAVFIGDSRIQGLTVYQVLNTSTVLATKGLMSNNCLTKEFVDMGNEQKGTIVDYLAEHQFNRVYIMFGINEVGCDVSYFTYSYKCLVNEISALQPDAEIYALSVFPMVEERTDEVYNNEIIKVFDDGLKELCEQEQITYVNVSAAVINDEGTLREELSWDGIHLGTEGLTRIVNYIMLATVEEQEN